jgi:hypothetical protein
MLAVGQRPAGASLAQAMRRQRALRRPRVIALIVAGLVVFLVISALLARVLSVDGAERSAITSLVQAQARGDAPAMIGLIEGCRTSAACRQRVALDARELTRTGHVEILELNPSAGFSLSSTLGTARVAWRAGNHLPVTQCVRVRRAGNALTGLRVELLEISARIKTDGDCPAHY